MLRRAMYAYGTAIVIAAIAGILLNIFNSSEIVLVIVLFVLVGFTSFFGSMYIVAGVFDPRKLRDNDR